MGSASQRSVQDLYEDVGDHYRIFIRAPFFQLLKHRDYWVPLLYFFFVLITMFWDLYCHSDSTSTKPGVCSLSICSRF